MLIYCKKKVDIHVVELDGAKEIDTYTYMCLSSVNVQ